MDPSLITLSAGRPAPKRVAHPGQEFVYILTGAVRLMTAGPGTPGTDDVLFPGDSCFLDAGTPHSFCSVRDHPWERTDAQLLVVSWHATNGTRTLPNGRRN